MKIKREKILKYQAASLPIPTEELITKYYEFLRTDYGIELKKGNLHEEKLMYFIHYNFNYKLYYNEDEFRDNTFSLNCVKSREIYGIINSSTKRYWFYKLIVDFLLKEQWIILEKNYLVDSHSTIFRVLVYSNTKNRYEFKSKWYEKIKNFKRTYRKDTINLEQQQLEIIKNIEFNLEEVIEKLIENKFTLLKEPYKKAKGKLEERLFNAMYSIEQSNPIEYLKYQRYYLSVFEPLVMIYYKNYDSTYARINGKVGRLFSSITSLSGFIIDCFTYKGEKFIELDSVNSQPLLLSKMFVMEGLITEDSKFLNACEEGIIYELIAKQNNLILNDENRKTFKQEFYTNILFASHNTLKNSKMGKILKDFDKDFFNALYEQLKSIGNDKLAIKLQNFEADIFLSIAKELNNDFIPCLTKHDSLLFIGEQYKEEIESKIVERIGKCKIKSK